MLKPLGNFTLNWKEFFQFIFCLVVGKGSSSRRDYIVPACNNKQTRIIDGLQLKCLEKQMNGCGLESNCISAVRNLRLFVRY
jgi:hypothetical protein